ANTSATGANVVTTALNSQGSVIVHPLGGGANCIAATSTSGGFNLSDDTSCGLSTATDRQSGNPLLGALANNGGPTLTELPQPGSPLIDAIPVPDCTLGLLALGTVDQRGVPRPQGAGCDIGAVEVVVPVAVTASFTG
ncbi:MAG TPA: choice-of-anchor Q domain-containing protein, partial [Acidimicrobiia bacterium]|nr:choice-of-anchor Q domain-containing protein [Acidimicrobiia bacterium]